MLGCTSHGGHDVGQRWAMDHALSAVTQEVCRYEGGVEVLRCTGTFLNISQRFYGKVIFTVVVNK